MANENQTPAAGAAFDAAIGKPITARDALLLFNQDDPDFNPDILAYKDSTGEKRAKQDEIIAFINAAMEEQTFSKIALVDKEPADRLGAGSQAIYDEVEKSTAFLSSFGKFAEQLKTLDFSKLDETVAKMTASVLRKAELASMNGFFRFVTNLYYTVTGQNKPAPTLTELQTEGRKELLKGAEAMADLEEAIDQVPVVEESLDKQDNLRQEFYSDYGLYVGAMMEAYRIWKEEKLPELAEKAKKSRSPMDIRNFQAMQRGVEFINEKTTRMSRLHKDSINELDTIYKMKEALATTQFNMMDHLTVTQNEWKSYATKQQAAGAIGAMVGTVQEVDRAKQAILKNDEKLSNAIVSMANASFGSSMEDAKRTIATMKATAESTIREAEEAVARAKALEGTRAALATAKDQLVAAKIKAAEISIEGARKIEQEIKLLEYKPGQTIDVEAELQKIVAPVPAPKA